jgi:hypothetical protein
MTSWQFPSYNKENPPLCPNNCWMTRFGKRMRKRCIQVDDKHDRSLVHLECSRCKGRIATAWILRFR